jgi:anti-sigma B factor antagonist
VAEFGVDVEERDGFAVIAVTGSVDLVTAPKLRERLSDVVGDGHLRLILDLRETEFLDSTGLGALVGVLKRLRLKDGEIRVVSGPGHVRKVFEITRLDKVFSMHESLEHAVG